MELANVNSPNSRPALSNVYGTDISANELTSTEVAIVTILPNGIAQVENDFLTVRKVVRTYVKSGARPRQILSSAISSNGRNQIIDPEKEYHKDIERQRRPPGTGCGGGGGGSAAGLTFIIILIVIIIGLGIFLGLSC